MKRSNFSKHFMINQMPRIIECVNQSFPPLPLPPRKGFGRTWMFPFRHTLHFLHCFSLYTPSFFLTHFSVLFFAWLNPFCCCICHPLSVQFCSYLKRLVRLNVNVCFLYSWNCITSWQSLFSAHDITDWSNPLKLLIPLKVPCMK